MNFRNPFKKLDQSDVERDRHKKQMHKEISSKALDIAKLVGTRRPCMNEIGELEILYKSYFKKYPDIEGEQRAIRRIAQLKSIARG